MVSLSLSLSLSSPGSQSHVARVSSSSRGPRCAGGQPRSALCQSRVSSGDISSSPTCRQDNLSATGNPAICLRAATTRTSRARHTCWHTTLGLGSRAVFIMVFILQVPNSNRESATAPREPKMKRPFRKKKRAGIFLRRFLYFTDCRRVVCASACLFSIFNTTLR